VAKAVFISSDEIRAKFAHAMSDMYRAEVPLYAELVDIVEEINDAALLADRDLARNLHNRDELQRLSAERHGAIRVGTAAELSLLRRAFAVMGMYPVGYYDLAIAGVPVHSTAFRPIDAAALARNPFRVFTSLLRPELIADPDLRQSVAAILAERRILSPLTEGLIERAEACGGLTSAEANAFVAELLETFRWQGDALVDAETYERLNDAHRLVADVVSFRGPHINHLTPRTLDIDAAQSELLRRGIDAKSVIEGPPRRRVPILLRQTSFKALEEDIRFVGQRDDDVGTHTARFGEIEQRGVALTPKGRALYDTLLASARGDDGARAANYGEQLSRAFASFPDSEEELRTEGLAYFRYSKSASCKPTVSPISLEHLIALGHVRAEPIVYEDFLPVSAAGIFQSNLGGEEQRNYAAQLAQSEFEAALGTAVFDPFALYEAIDASSRAEVLALFQVPETVSAKQ